MSDHERPNNYPPVTLSLMVTNPEDLATMLAVINQHSKRTEPAATDLAKQARAERDEAMATAVGWRRSAEEAQQRFIEATQHAESLADQLETETARRRAAEYDRDECSGLLQAANEKLDGGPNQRISESVVADAAEHAAALAERRRLLGGVADIHPDEDPHDHDPNLPGYAR